jgi:hypothetical protein
MDSRADGLGALERLARGVPFARVMALMGEALEARVMVEALVNLTTLEWRGGGYGEMERLWREKWE